MDKTRTTPRLHPQWDAMVEGFKRTIEGMLSKFVAENQGDWDSHLPILMMAYRSAVHETTSFTPCEFSSMWGTRSTFRLTFSLDDLSKKVVPREVREGKAQVVLHDRKVQNRGFECGDPVWLHNRRHKKGRTLKLQRPWEGPYLVTSCLDHLIYRI